MDREDLLVSTVMGFIVGLFAFGAGYVRVRRWTSALQSSRPSAQGGEHDQPLVIHPTGPRLPSLSELVEHYLALERWLDLVFVALVLAMLIYGAIVAPRLRYVLLVALVTVAVTWWAARAVMKWLRGGRAS